MNIQSVLKTLKSFEPIFHHPEIFGTSPKDIDNQMSDNFWEVGASGNVYTKQDIVAELLKRYNDPNYEDIWQTQDFEIREIAPQNYLLTYVLIQNKTRHTRRCTLWRKTEMGWKILYHQGTVMPQIS